MEAGKTLLHYRLVEKIGEGGMGVVWKAVDTTLDRNVAIKILPEVFAGDNERMARFGREAKLLASLNHPHIATVHGFHEADGTHFLVMELVEGQDLQELLAAGPLPLERALGIALQIATALEAAHESGVIHRDLKPANVRLTADGQVKVLDLGLAKALETEPLAADGNITNSPTVTSAGTLAGMLLGTAAYMSPEQARGQPADRRSDIWAFGCVLFEMLAGRQCFAGPTVTDTLASVLKTEPAWERLPADTPRAIRRLLRRCLTQDADRRLHHLADARIEIGEALEAPEEEQPAPMPVAAPTTPAWKRALPWALVLVFVATTTFLALQRAGSDTSTDAPPMHLAIPFPDGLNLVDGQKGSLDLSPDGKTLVLLLYDESGRKLLYLRRLGSAEVIPLAGTENASTPFFSPDGEWIAFFADDALKKISVQGGAPLTLYENSDQNRGATWGADDVIVFTPSFDSGLAQVSGVGGTPTPLTTLDLEKRERTHRWPHIIPGTDVVLFTVGTLDSPENYDDSRIDAVRLGTGERRTVFEGASLARYAPSGHLVFSRAGFLHAVPFDVDKLETTGSPVPVLEGVMGARRSGVVHASISQNGLLAYVAGEYRAAEGLLTWINRDGTTETMPAPGQDYLSPTLSPDETRIAVGVSGDAVFDIWVYEIERETLTRLTFEGDNVEPRWSPDGKRIAFGSVRDDRHGVWVKPADGSGEATLLHAQEGHSPYPNSFSPDGRLLAMTDEVGNSGDITILQLEGDNAVTPFVATPSHERWAQFSPDGKWIAYTSDQSGRSEIYVRAYPGPGGQWQISANGGREPLWRADGRELFFRAMGGLRVVDVDTSDGFRAGKPRVLLDGFSGSPGQSTYSATQDGQRLVLVQDAADESRPDRVSVVVGWLDDVTRRVPTAN